MADWQMLRVRTTHAMRKALEYTCLIPAHEKGMRRFCLWALGLAVMTLRKLHKYPHFTSGNEVKVSRRTVRATILTTELALSSNRAVGSPSPRAGCRFGKQTRRPGFAWAGRKGRADSVCDGTAAAFELPMSHAQPIGELPD